MKNRYELVLKDNKHKGKEHHVTNFDSDNWHDDDGHPIESIKPKEAIGFLKAYLEHFGEL